MEYLYAYTSKSTLNQGTGVVVTRFILVPLTNQRGVVQEGSAAWCGLLGA